MIRLTALNDSKNNDLSTEPRSSSKEGHVKIILKEYNNALRLIVDDKKQEALVLFNQALCKVVPDGFSSNICAYDQLLHNVVCSSLKHIANIYIEMGNCAKALAFLYRAIFLDDCDLLLLFKAGTVAMKINNLETGALALRKSLDCSFDHWPSIDSMIPLLYSVKDIMNCLLYTFIALMKDPSYKKGLILGHEILKSFPMLDRLCGSSLKKFFWNDSGRTQSYDDVNFLISTRMMSHDWTTFNLEEAADSAGFLFKVRTPESWTEVGNMLLEISSCILNKNLSLFSPIKIIYHGMIDGPAFVLCQNQESNFPEVHEPSEDSRMHLENDISEIHHSSELLMRNQTEKLICENQSTQDQELVLEKSVHSGVEINSVKSQTMSPIYHYPSNEDMVQACQLPGSNFNGKKRQRDWFLEESNLGLDEMYQNEESDQVPSEQSQKIRKRSRVSVRLTNHSDPKMGIRRPSRTKALDHNNDGKSSNLETILKQVFPCVTLPNGEQAGTQKFPRYSHGSTDSSQLPFQSTGNKFGSTPRSTGLQQMPSSSKVRGGRFLDDSQKHDVGLFLENHNGHIDVSRMMVNFMSALCRKWNYIWPDALSEIYLRSYSCVRYNILHPSPFDTDEPKNHVDLDLRHTILFCELYLDKYLDAATSNPSCLENITIGLFAIDVEDFSHLSVYNSMSEDQDLHLPLRSLWTQANISLCKNDKAEASRILKMMSNHIEKAFPDDDQFMIKLVNLKYNAVINLDRVQGLLEQIQRDEDLREAEDSYGRKEYDNVLKILSEEFNSPDIDRLLSVTREISLNHPRYLMIFLESLWHSQRLEDCLIWSGNCLHVSWVRYSQSYESGKIGSEWLQAVEDSLQKMEECTSQLGTTIGNILPRTCSSRLVQDLAEITHHHSESSPSLMKSTSLIVTPWIILHLVLQSGEDHLSKSTPVSLELGAYGNSPFEIPEDRHLPASIMVLTEAHRILGRQGLCCTDGGKLLKYMMKICIPKFQSTPQSSPIRGELKELLEQIVFCLYGITSKPSFHVKSKLKIYEEHVKTHITLAWDTCPLLFELYRPTNLPSFDSKRNDSINADTVNIFKRICSRIPREHDPVSTIDDMKAYLLGIAETHPLVTCRLPDPISCIYYLIADYYFKTVNHQSWANAIRYYMLDLCLHPSAQNSWVGLAMATSTLMETWLNNIHPNMTEEKYLSKARIAQKSYQRAVELDPSHLTVWTEYGSFLYTVHSFCSRSLKQDSDSLSMGKFQYLEDWKEESLETANHCFLTAHHVYESSEGINQSQDERWLFHYMQGKIAEKKGVAPSHFLSHFTKAHRSLLSCAAQYPKRINHKSPQFLAIEALEICYKIHASILKFLDKSDDKPLELPVVTILQESLQICRASPCTTHTSILESNEFDDYHTQTLKGRMFITKSSIQSCSGDNDPQRIDSDPSGNPQGRGLQIVVQIPQEGCNSSLHTISQDPVGMDSSVTAEIDRCHEQLESACDTVDLRMACNLSNVVSECGKAHLNIPNDVCHGGSDPLMAMKEADINMEQQKAETPQDELHHAYQSPRVPIFQGESLENTNSTNTSTSTTQLSTSSSSGISDVDVGSRSSVSSSDLGRESPRVEIVQDGNDENDIVIRDDEGLTNGRTDELVKICLAGLEQCVLRFPEHYKSIFRLAHFYFFNQRHKSVIRSKQLLLGTYDCRFYPGESIQGLFSERKNSNLFNGIWRIPVHEIDRPGSFASHMSKCVLLLMQVLNELGDTYMLSELCVHLGRMPDPDKKYLRDIERRQLAKQSMTLCVQCFRARMKSVNSQGDQPKFWSSNERLKILMDIHQTYQMMKQAHDYEHNEISRIRKLLEDAYSSMSAPCGPIEGTLEQAMGFCKQITKKKLMSIANHPPDQGPNLEGTGMDSSQIVLGSSKPLSSRSLDLDPKDDGKISHGGGSTEENTDSSTIDNNIDRISQVPNHGTPGEIAQSCSVKSHPTTSRICSLPTTLLLSESTINASSSNSDCPVPMNRGYSEIDAHRNTPTSVLFSLHKTNESEAPHDLDTPPIPHALEGEELRNTMKNDEACNSLQTRIEIDRGTSVPDYRTQSHPNRILAHIFPSERINPAQMTNDPQHNSWLERQFSRGKNPITNPGFGNLELPFPNDRVEPEIPINSSSVDTEADETDLTCPTDPPRSTHLISSTQSPLPIRSSDIQFPLIDSESVLESGGESQSYNIEAMNPRLRARWRESCDRKRIEGESNGGSISTASFSIDPLVPPDHYNVLEERNKYESNTADVQRESETEKPVEVIVLDD